jgi:hypothetical protein
MQIGIYVMPATNIKVERMAQVATDSFKTPSSQK